MMHGCCTAASCQASKKTLTLPAMPTVVQIPGRAAGGLPGGHRHGEADEVEWQLGRQR